MMRAIFILPFFTAASFMARVDEAQMTEAALGVPAFDKVLTMLQNLEQQIDAESAADETNYQDFLTWFTEQEKSTSASVEALTAKLKEIAAALADLNARKQTLTSEVHDLNVELDGETSALNEATEKRQTEHDGFVKEQLDFDNAIAACNKAAEMLTAHFGDGEPKESTKPAWMSLTSIFHSIKMASDKVGRPVPAFMQQPNFFNANGASLNDAHQDSTGEAVNIVSEVQALSQTFAEDKQSSVDQENDLQHAFDALAGQKRAMIASLTGQRDSQQNVLNGVTQQIAEHDGAEQVAGQTLQSEQAYVTSLGQQQSDTTALYEKRKGDRTAEKEAVTAAHTVLQEQMPSLLQLKRSHQRRAFIQVKTSSKDCKGCSKAAALLSERASKFHSELLATASASLARKAPDTSKVASLIKTGVSSLTHQIPSAAQTDTLAPVVKQIEELVVRLDQQGAAEEKHKAWCDKERTESNEKRDRHAAIVTQLDTSISNGKDTIEDKQLALQDNADAVTKADSDFQELQNLRTKATADYEAELQDYRDAVSALSQASDMLTEFYRSSGEALVQTKRSVRQAPVVPDAAARADAPGMMGEYEQKGGPAGVLGILAECRKNFEAGQAALEASEVSSASEFTSQKGAYTASRQQLVDGGNRLTVEMQSAQGALAADEENLASNQAEVTAAEQYLAQVGASCNSLEAHFSDRQALRGQERQALQDAIQVLQTSA